MICIRFARVWLGPVDIYMDFYRSVRVLPGFCLYFLRVLEFAFAVQKDPPLTYDPLRDTSRES